MHALVEDVTASGGDASQVQSLALGNFDAREQPAVPARTGDVEVHQRPSTRRGNVERKQRVRVVLADVGAKMRAEWPHLQRPAPQTRRRGLDRDLFYHANPPLQRIGQERDGHIAIIDEVDRALVHA